MVIFLPFILFTVLQILPPLLFKPLQKESITHLGQDINKAGNLVTAYL